MRTSLFALVLLSGCSGKVTSTVDEDLRNRVETVKDCFPHLFELTLPLLAVADTWRQQDGAPLQDPPGLTWVEQPGGSVDVVFGPSATVVSMTIRFYGPAGDQQDLDLTGAVTLDEAIERAATQLATLFPGGDPFLVGDWTISGSGAGGSGTLTGLIGGSANGNELAELRTTAGSATVNGGPPATDSATIAETSPEPCALTLTLPALRTDTTPGQQYPIGDVLLTITGPDATVGATMTFDGSSVALIAVDGVRGRFAFDVETRAINYVP